MSQTNNNNFEHRRSTTVEGFATIVKWLVSLVIAFFIFVMAKTFAPINSEIKWGLIIIIGIITVFCFFYAYMNFRARGFFICRIDNEQLIVISPVKAIEKSFSVSIKEIKKIVKETGNGDGADYKWYVWNTAGEKFKMPINYENPIEKFIQEILIRRPDLTITETSYLDKKE